MWREIAARGRGGGWGCRYLAQNVDRWIVVTEYEVVAICDQPFSRSLVHSHLYFQAGVGQHGDEGIHAEEVEFSAHEVADPGLSDPQAFGRLSTISLARSLNTSASSSANPGCYKILYKRQSASGGVS